MIIHSRQCATCPRTFLPRPASTETRCVVCRSAHIGDFRKGTQAQRVIRALCHMMRGTAHDVSLMADVPLKNCQAYLCKFRQDGLIERVGDKEVSATKRSTVYAATQRTMTEAA